MQFQDKRTIVIYVFHVVNDNVKYFIEHGLFESKTIDFIIVCNGNIKLNVPDYVKYINRENKY